MFFRFPVTPGKHMVNNLLPCKFDLFVVASLTDGFDGLLLFFEFHDPSAFRHRVYETLQFKRRRFDRVEHQVYSFTVGPLEDFLFREFAVDNILFGQLEIDDNIINVKIIINNPHERRTFG